MLQEKDMLDDYLPDDTGNKRLHNFLLLCIMAYILYNAYSLYKREALNDIAALIVAIIIPLTGLILFYFKKRIGWLICAVYFTVMCSIMLLMLVKSMAVRYAISSDIVNSVKYYSYVLLLTVTAVVIWLRPTRQSLRLDRNYWIAAIMLTSVLAGLAAFGIFYR